MLVLGTASIAQAAGPKIAQIVPHPFFWVVDDAGLTEVTLTFDSPVLIPAGAITGRTLGLGSVPVGVDADPGVLTDTVVVSFADVRDDRLTLVVDYTIVNAAGEALDGEVDLPLFPSLPTGDGGQGGQAVFQLTVLQGDASRDGFVNVIDVIFLILAEGSQPGDANWNPLADLNSDGVVNGTDANLLLAVLPAAPFLPQTDGVPPSVIATSTDDLPLLGGEFLVLFDEAIDPASITRTSVYAVGVNGELKTPISVHSPIGVGETEFIFTFDDFACMQEYKFTVSNAVGDESGQLSAVQHDVTLIGIDVDPPVITCPDVTYVNSTQPNGIPVTDFAVAGELLAFLAQATATDECGAVIVHNIDVNTDIPLGMKMVTFAAVDAAGNTDSCEVPMIVVQSVAMPGVPGADGAQGPGGSSGSDGSTGPVGPAGPEGPAGSNGLQGETGATGASGSEGPQGSAGAQGSEGLPGVTGADGPQGEPGADAVLDQPAGQTTPDAGGAEDTTATNRRFCGTVGALAWFCLLTGLTGMRLSLRRQRS